MSKPCAVFWDIQNVGIPRGQSANSIIKLIRSTIIKPHNLNEIFFFCVCDVKKLSSNVGHSLNKLDIDIVQAYDGAKDSADIKILELMRRFMKISGKDSTIILLSGDADYYGSLNDLKKQYNVSIHLIRLVNSFSSKLDQISDYIFLLNNGSLKPIKSTGLPMYFISIKNHPLDMDIKLVMANLNGQVGESIQKSAILFEDSICIGFPTLFNAEKAVEQLNGSRFHGRFLKVELIVDSPLTDILKCIKPDVTVETKNINEVKQLTFIKMNNSNGTADNSKIIKFCIACTSQSGSQCILSRKSFLWIVFSYKSYAEDCLTKVKIMYPDAVISKAPIDLTLGCDQNPYTVESCQPKVKNETRSSAEDSYEVKSKPEKFMRTNSQSQSFNELNSNNNPSPVIEPKTVETESQNVDLDDNDGWKIFFHCDNYFISNMLPDQPSKWSLLYNLFEKLYDLGAKKVIFDGNLYCAHFDSVSAYQNAFEEKRSRFLKPLESIYAKERDQQVSKQLKRYVNEIPWCFNEELNLHCLVVKIDPQFYANFLEISRNQLGNRGCIFIKPVLTEIWIGFPDEFLCKNSKMSVLRLLASIKQLNDVTIDKPSNKLLESINFSDLVGDAYDLAFLSSLLEPLKPIAKPLIIERISHLRSEEQEFNGTFFHITVKANFRHWLSWNKLSLEQIVKILVNFSKVIPLAATASYDEVNLIFKSWYEAHAARHFINSLTPSEVPFFTHFQCATDFKQDNSAFGSIFAYFFVNDKRKILEKIVQNKSIIDRLKSFKVQSKPDTCALYEETLKKLQKIQSLLCIKTDSEFKFTSGMISIIKMHLELMDCPVCVEFDDKIWVAIDDSEKGKKTKAKIEQIKFKVLHEKDEDDFKVGIVIQLAHSCPSNVNELLIDKILSPTKAPIANTHSIPNAVPLGHFNYNYRKAVGMPIRRYCKLNAAD